jgi:hypothetical protein
MTDEEMKDKEEYNKVPDYKGFINVAGWVKVNSNGVKFITIKLSQYCDLYETAVKK